MEQSKRTSGFTLIELLVVISIIALLMSVMMPALGRAKRAAEAIVCKSHQKDIGLAFSMYVGEYDRNVVWTAGSTAYAGGRWMQQLSVFMYQRNQNSSSNPIAAAKEGGIYDFELYRCPVENRKAKKAGFNPDGTSIMGNSGVYGYNQFFTGYPATDNYSKIQGLANTREENAWRKFDEIVRPATLPLFADTSSDNPAELVSGGLPVVGYWWLSAKGPHENAYFEYNWNGGPSKLSQTSREWSPRGPAPNHNGKTNYLMADGHVETKGIWEWQDHLGTDFHPKRNVKIKPPTPPADYFRF